MRPMLTTLEIVSVAFYFIISTTVVTSNLFVVISILSIKKLRKPPNLLLVSLAVADLSAGAIAIPLRLSEVYKASFTLDVDYCRVSHCFTLLNITGSILNLVAIAVERFIAIEFPYKYIQLIYQRIPYPIYSIITTWLIVIGITFLPLYAWGSNGKHGPRSAVVGICKFNETLDPTFVRMILLGIVIFSILVIITLNTRIYITARKHMRRNLPIPVRNCDNMKSNESQTNVLSQISAEVLKINSLLVSTCCSSQVIEINVDCENNNSNKTTLHSNYSVNQQGITEFGVQQKKPYTISFRSNEKDDSFCKLKNNTHKRRKSHLRMWKITKTMFTMFFVFSVCWLAFIIPTSIFLSCAPCANKTIVMLSTVIIFSSGALNPVIFYFKMKTFRREIKKFFIRFLKKFRKY